MSIADFSYLFRLYSPYIWSILSIATACYCLSVAIGYWQHAIKLQSNENIFYRHLLAPLSTKLKVTDENELKQIRLTLQRAGFRGESAIAYYENLRLYGILLAVTVVVLMRILGFSFLVFSLTLVAMWLFIGAFPTWWLGNLAVERQEKIAVTLPNVVDLMVLCLEVGLSIEGAFDKVTKEMQEFEPVMAEEAGLLLAEMNAGVPFGQAFRRMADRVGLEELLVLSRLISQGASVGASLTQTLREYSEQSFERKVLKLDEYVGKVNGWLVMPVALCFLPAVFLMLGVPIFVVLKENI